MGAICYLSPTFANFFPVFEEIRQCIACTCYAPFFWQCVKHLQRHISPAISHPKSRENSSPGASSTSSPTWKRERAQILRLLRRRRRPSPRAAKASRSLPPSPHTLTPHSYPLFPLPPRPWHSLPKWAASSVVEGGREGEGDRGAGPRAEGGGMGKQPGVVLYLLKEGERGG